MSIKIIGGNEIPMNVKAPPVTPLILDDENYDENYEEFSVGNSNDNDVTVNNICFVIVIALLIMILFRVSDIKEIIKNIFAEI